MLQSAQPAAPYLPENHAATVFTVQALMGDRRNIAVYEGIQHLPFCIKAPIPWDDCLQFFSREERVTFTARMPLEIAARGVDAILQHLQTTAFVVPVFLENYEFRPVGAVLDEFDIQLAGDMLLQVVCNIHADEL